MLAALNLEGLGSKDPRWWGPGVLAMLLLLPFWERKLPRWPQCPRRIVRMNAAALSTYGSSVGTQSTAEGQVSRWWVAAAVTRLCLECPPLHWL